MSLVLVDTSIWIEYLKNPRARISNELEVLIDSDLACTNDLILAELLPSLLVRNELSLSEAFQSMQSIPLLIDWAEIVNMQLINLKSGVNKVGIPDLMIAQNSIQNNIPIFTLDKHFELMKEKAKIPIQLR